MSATPFLKQISARRGLLSWSVLQRCLILRFFAFSFLWKRRTRAASAGSSPIAPGASPPSSSMLWPVSPSSTIGRLLARLGDFANGQQRAPVLGQLRRRPRDRGDRRGDVDVRDERLRGAARRDPRPPDQQRHVARGLVREVLTLADPVLAREVAVVRGEDQIGVVELALVLERVDDRRDPLVDREQHLEPRPAPALDLVQLPLAEHRQPPQEARLVADVLLVLARRLRQRHAGEGALVARRGDVGRVRRVEVDAQEEGRGTAACGGSPRPPCRGRRRSGSPRPATRRRR